MALATLTVRDGDAPGKVECSVTREPPISDDEPLTSAQATVLSFLDFLGADPESLRVRGCDDDNTEGDD